jgi:hypothetical protein
MSRRLPVAALAITLLIGLAYCVSPGVAEDPPAKDSAPSKETSIRAAKLTPDEWTGKVIAVTNGWLPVALENVRLRQLGNQTFLVGRALDDNNQPMASGRMTWIRLESVTQVVEFANVKEYRKAMEAMPRWPAPAVAPAVVPAVPAVPVQ